MPNLQSVSNPNRADDVSPRLLGLVESAGTDVEHRLVNDVAVSGRLDLVTDPIATAVMRVTPTRSKLRTAVAGNCAGCTQCQSLCTPRATPCSNPESL